MDVGRLTPGQKIAAGSGLALLVIMFFPWFGVSVDAVLVKVSESVNAWQSFGGIDLILFIAVIAAVGIPFMIATNRSLRLPIAASAVIAGLGILATILVAYRIIDPPGVANIDLDRKIGVFLGLIAAAGIAYGGWKAMQEEGTTFSEARDQLGDAISGDKPGAAGSPAPPTDPAPPAGPPPAGPPAPPPADPPPAPPPGPPPA